MLTNPVCQTDLTLKLLILNFCQEYPLGNGAVFTLDQTYVDYGVTYIHQGWVM